ncbi:MAG: 4-hydroxybenzoate polyprenyltransferase-like prenyltransferase [Frankiales bacterium]|nr:4-hydroxybenzoate polyprenyltransferase-like prenyltransferase [Frankiales bacterium]
MKNLLVGAAPLAAAQQFRPHVLPDTLLAFAVFTLAAAGTYLVNDVRDLQGDRRHPVKQHRPIARGDVSPRLAISAAVLLLVGAVALPLLTGHGQLAACMATYVVLMQAYSLGLKDEPVVDLAIVASGFLLRAMAGGLAAELPLSRWFLMVSAFGSLFMVAGKRYSELVSLGSRAGEVRTSLSAYSPTYLRFVWAMSAGVLLTAYSLWAFEVAAAMSDRASAPWSAISVAPFVLAVLRYALDVDRGEAAEPEDIVLHDRGLQVIAVLWLLTFGLGAAGV